MCNMVLGLAPPKRGSGDYPGRRGIAVLHALGLLSGGAITGCVLGALGAIVSHGLGNELLAALALMAAGTYAGVDLGLWRFPHVAPGWQVPRVWLRDLPGAAAYAGFGVLLGVGILTAVPFAAFTALLVLEFSVASYVIGTTVGVAYGLGRILGLALGIQLMSQADHPTAAVVRMMASHSAWRRPLGLAAIGAASAQVALVWFV